MTDILSQLRSLDSKRAALDQVVRQTQARVRSSHAQDDRAAKRHAEELPATGAPAVASDIQNGISVGRNVTLNSIIQMSDVYQQQPTLRRTLP